jgi:ferric-dicitrate binding protein FerR (iron transport regulator)
MNTDDGIARTLARAGARRSISADLTTDVRQTVENAWRESISRRNRGRWRRRSMQAAAALMFGVGLAAAIAWRVQHRMAPPVGIFLASRGAVDIQSPNNTRLAVGGMTLAPGTRIRTGPEGQALLTIGEISVRVGPASLVTLKQADRILMGPGKIYIDFGSHDGQAHDLSLITPFGSIEHLGTQFQADIGAQEMTVRVREGHVRLLTKHGEQLIGALEAARVDHMGRVRVQAIRASGEDWAWTTALVPDFPIEGRSLAEFLEWYTRETGKRIDYASPAIFDAARRTRLSGSIVGLSPEAALTAVLASTQFDYSLLEDGAVRLTMHNQAHAKLQRDGMDRLETRPPIQD